MKMQLFLFCLLCYYFFFLLFSLYLFVLYCLHVLDVRSADVTARVASSKICAGSCAAALRIRRLSWTAQPFLCILHEEKYRGVAVCPSRTQLLSRRAGVMTLAAHTEAEPELITDWDPPAPNFLPIQRLRRQTGCLSAALCLRVCVSAMEGDLHGDCSDVSTLHVKTEAVDENPSALVVGSREPPAPCGDTACRGGGGGVDQTAEELADNTTTPVLLCECTH